MGETFTETEAAGSRVSGERRRVFEALALALTQVPTAAGREERVVRRIGAWCAERGDLRCGADAHGNLVIEHAEATPAAERAPLFITAHLDHPAFTVEARGAGGELLLTFRGGVHDPYFVSGRIVVFTGEDRPVRARLVESVGPDTDPSHREGARYLRTCVAAVEGADAEAASELRAGDIGRWDLPTGSIEVDGGTGERLLRSDACDDLAPLAAALCAMDVLRDRREARHVRLLFTRAEEVGFVGAIAACREGTMPAGSRALLLEASRAYADSPVGGGPIVRVGDRANTFSPSFTAAITKLAESLRASDAGGGAGGASGEDGGGRAFRFQRKLMPGGVCESSAFLAYGYDSTCVCLPLGNYHNMADLAAVADERDPDAIANATVAREYVSVEDFHDLVRLLVAVGVSLETAEPMTERLEKLHRQRRRILTDPAVFDASMFSRG